MIDYDANIYIEGAASHPDQSISEPAIELFELFDFYDSHFNENEFIVDFEKPYEPPMITDNQNEQTMAFSI